MSFHAKAGFSSDVLNFKDCCFSLVFQEGQEKAHQIVHNRTGETVTIPDEITITSAFLIKDNHLDFAAMLHKKPSKYMMYEFFDDRAKFLQTMYTGKGYNGLKLLANGVRDEIQKLENEKAAQIVVDSDRVVAPAIKKRQEASLLKAREALKKQKADRESRAQIMAK
eukprot:6783022-Lingulodinium_polyedra.AAC.1